MSEEFENPDVLEETSTDYLINMWYSAEIYGIHFGWLLLASVLLLLYLWPEIQRKLDSAYKSKQARAYDAKCKKNPDWLLARQQAMDAARQRMQEELSRKAKEHEEKMKEREEQQRQERLSQLDSDAGGHTLGSDSKKTKSTYKPEYHPLMGSGPSTTYRPPRRSCCPSGGCG